MTSKDQPRRPLLRPIVFGIFCASLIPLYKIAATITLWPVDFGESGKSLAWNVSFFELPLGALLWVMRLLIVISPLVAWSLLKPPRKLAVWLLCTLYVVALLYFPYSLAPVDRGYRTRRFAAAAERGNVINDALSRYRRVNGDYPESLEDLVPEFLDEVPFTDLMAHPEFQYTKEVSWSVPEGQYELLVWCGRGIGNFDRFFYWPSETYPEEGLGGWIERIRNWAYVHE